MNLFITSCIICCTFGSVGRSTLSSPSLGRTVCCAQSRISSSCGGMACGTAGR